MMYNREPVRPHSALGALMGPLFVLCIAAYAILIF